MMAGARSAVRIQRFEILVAVVVTAILAVSAVVVRLRLDGLGVSPECWANFLVDGFSLDVGPCSEPLNQFGLINGEEAGKVMAGMAIAPYLLGFVLGVPLVAREIEVGTAPTVWALVTSRSRWLAGRLVPIGLLLVVLLAILGAVSELLWLAREPWSPYPNFGDVGLHGTVLLAKGVATLAVGLFVGAVIGRSLPAFLLSVGAGLVIAYVSATLMWAWFQSEAIKFAIPMAELPAHVGAPFPGGTYFATGWVTPDGRVVFGQEEMLAFAPSGKDPQTWLHEDAPQVQIGLPGSEYPRWALIETAGFGLPGVVGLLIAFPVVDRRRPL